MGQPEGRHFQPQDSNAVDFSHRPIERENQQDILGFATALLRRAPMTPIDRQIVSHSLKEIETVQQILLDWMIPPPDSRRLPLSFSDALLRTAEDIRKPPTFYVVEYPEASYKAKFNLLHPRMIGNYADPTRASKSCVEAITRGMGATEDGESFHDIVSVFDREMSKNGLSPHDTESELLVATHFPSAELILQPHFARVDLLLSAPSLAASLTSR